MTIQIVDQQRELLISKKLLHFACDKKHSCEKRIHYRFGDRETLIVTVMRRKSSNFVYTIGLDGGMENWFEIEKKHISVFCDDDQTMSRKEPIFYHKRRGTSERFYLDHRPKVRFGTILINLKCGKHE